MKSVRTILLLLLLIIPKDVHSKEFWARNKRLSELPFFLQECKEEPEVDNAVVKCSYQGCTITCQENYKMAASSSGVTTLLCDRSSGTLTLNGAPWQTQDVACNPTCGLNVCNNGGTCKEESCVCLPGYTGNSCQIPVEVTPPDPNTCPDPDFPVINAQVTRSDQELVVRCNTGYVFEIGGTNAFIQCRSGMWDHPTGIFSTGGALVCRETQCDPPCLHGGVCLTAGVCDCPYKYWGPVCQSIRCAFPDAALLQNSSLGGVHSRMKIQCHPRYKMVSGRRSQTIVCKGGEWNLPGRGLMKNNDVRCYSSK